MIECTNCHGQFDNSSTPYSKLCKGCRMEVIRRQGRLAIEREEAAEKKIKQLKAMSLREIRKSIIKANDLKKKGAFQE